MNYWKLLWMMPVFIIGGLIFGIVRGGIIMNEKSSTVENECTPTDLYIIGYKGHRHKVYDCHSVES